MHVAIGAMCLALSLSYRDSFSTPAIGDMLENAMKGVYGFITSGDYLALLWCLASAALSDKELLETDEGLNHCFIVDSGVSC